MSETQTHKRRASVEVADNPVVYCMRLYTQFLQGLFNFNPAGCFHWEPDPELTEIVIRAEAPLDMEVVGKRPAITVVPGPIQYQGLGIDNTLTFRLMTEEHTRSDLFSGHLVVYCLAESDIVAQQLAHMVTHGTRSNQRLLEGEGGFHTIARPAPSANAPSPPGALVVGDPQGLVMVQVNIPFAFQWTWRTTPKAPASQRSLDMVTSKARASDFPYTSPSTLEKVQLAMSTTPVLVRQLSRGSAITAISVREGQDRFQTVLTEKGVDELASDED